jgi:hypothetical protein
MDRSSSQPKPKDLKVTQVTAITDIEPTADYEEEP